MAARTARRKDRLDLAGERDLRRDRIVRGRALDRDEDEDEQNGGDCGAYSGPPPGFLSVSGFGAAAGLKSSPVYCISSQV